MSRRKWLARGLVLLIVAGLAAAGLLYQYWTNPTAVRQQVINQLATHFVGVHVSLESSRLRLLGGIAVRELRPKVWARGRTRARAPSKAISFRRGRATPHIRRRSR